jgi:hypothetical protein
MICGPPITAQSGHALRSPLTLGIISGNPFQNVFASTVRTLHKYVIVFSGCVWIGTGGKGVVRLLSDRNIPVQHYTRNDGLSSDFIHSRRSRSIMVWTRIGVTSKYPCVMFLIWSRGSRKFPRVPARSSLEAELRSANTVTYPQNLLRATQRLWSAPLDNRRTANNSAV